MCDCCDDLKQRIEILESLVGTPDQKLWTLNRKLKVSQSMARILVELDKVYPSALTSVQLDERIPVVWNHHKLKDPEYRGIHTMNVHVWATRKRLGKDVILTESKAYRLSERGHHLVQAALA